MGNNKFKFACFTPALLILLTIILAQRAQLCAETVGKELVAHAPIFVEGNQNFTYENGVTSGSGTATDPYIIENWKINATTANGIEIRNTNAFFVIRNCEIYGKPYFSIYLCNVTHGNIENITSYGHVRGVELFCSSEIAIANSTLYDNYYYGIICSYSYNITISNLVTRNNSYWGIYLHTCSNINLENSTAQGNSYGIIMKLCANIKIANCKVNSNTQQGVCIEDCIQTILKNNTLENNKYNLGVKGKELAHYYHEIAASNTVDTKPVYYIIEQSNLVFNTTTVGYLALISCNNTRVENLTIAKNIQALLLTNTSFSTVANCSFYESYCGVELQSSSDSSIKNCSVYNNSMYGIYLGKSSHALIANCSLWDNYISVGFDSSSDSSIKGSLIYESFTGISLWGSSNNSITSNRIYNNTHGAKVTASTQLIFRNNSFENNKFSFGVSGWNIQDYYHDIDISNTINSKPIHYIIENNNTTFNESLQIGYLAIISSSYCSVENTTFSSNLQGLLLANSSFSTVSNCSFQSNLEALSIWRSSALTILNSTFYNNSNVGVSVIESSELNIINSQFDVNGAGTRIESSRNITVADSIFSNNSIGSALLESSLSNFENCSFYNNANSLLLTSSTNNLFINCSSHSNSENAFSFMSSSKNTIASCNAINSKEGFSFKQSFNNNIAWCSAYNNKKGFKFEQSSNNNISSCVAYSNQYGFLVEASLNNKFTNCKSYLNFNGIVFKLSSSYNELLRCYVHNNSECGAQFLNSPENILFENQFENNTWNLGVDGDEMLDYYQNIDSSNKINNKPVYYLIEESELLLNESSPLGYLALVSCSNIIIKNLNFTNNYQGILLADTANVIVVNCSIYNNFHGVWLYSSAKTVIANTRISGNFYGVSTTKSIGTKVYYCDILNNTNYGIYSYNAESEYSINASYNWWGSAQGPGNETHPIVGSDKISANVIFKPWLIEYFELSPLVIERTKPENATVNVAPDTTITIVFSKIIDFSTIPNNISITELEIKNYSLDNDDRTIVLELSANLESYRRYTVTLNTDIKDRFGNCLSSYYQFWFRAKDITAPVIEIISPLNNTITKSNVTIVYSLVDNADIPENITVNIANNTPYHEEGIYTIIIEAIDQAGNVGFAFVAFTIDKTPPVIRIISPSNNTITNQNIILTYSVSDNFDSYEHIQVNIPSGKSYTEEGDYVLNLEVKDRASNMARALIVFRIDKSAPRITITSPVENFITNQNVTLIYYLADNFDEPQNITTNIPSGVWYVNERIYEILILAIDRAGNIAEKTIRFIIDRTPPEITILKPLNNTITDQNITLSYFATDNFDSFENISFNMPNDILYDQEGNYTISIIGMDRASNKGVADVSFIIDRTPPNITIAGVENGKYYNTDIIPVIEIVDLSISEIKTTLNNESFGSGQMITEEGLYWLEVQVIDKLGRSSRKELSFIIDKTKPFISYLQPTSGLKTYETTVLISGKTEENATVNIKAPQGSFSKIAPNGVFSFEVPLWAGENIIVIETVDLAGNKEITSLKVIKEEVPTPYYYEHAFQITIFAIFVFIIVVIIAAGILFLKEK